MALAILIQALGRAWCKFLRERGGVGYSYLSISNFSLKFLTVLSHADTLGKISACSSTGLAGIEGCKFEKFFSSSDEERSGRRPTRNEF